MKDVDIKRSPASQFPAETAAAAAAAELPDTFEYQKPPHTNYTTMSNPNFGWGTNSQEVASHFASNIKGKTILITGVSPTSLSNSVIHSLVPHSPATIIAASRSPKNISDVISSLPANSTKFHSINLDLSSLSSVREAAKDIAALGIKIDILLDNAGVMAIADYRRTVDGFEMQMATNHLGHFLLYNLLRKSGSLAGPVRVVAVSSIGHEFENGQMEYEDPWFSGGENYNAWHAYSKSKTANLLMAVELARRGVSAVAVHPGPIDTGLGRDLAPGELEKLRESFEFKTPDQGAAGLVVAMLDGGVEGK